VTTGNYSAVADLHISQFTVTHTLVFSIFTSRILATDLMQYYFNAQTDRHKLGIYIMEPQATLMVSS
jgi:hypothetical protein